MSLIKDIMSRFGKNSSPEKPTIQNEEEYIEWVFRHGEQWKNFKNIIIGLGYNHDEMIIKLVASIKDEIDKYQNGYELLNLLAVYGEHQGKFLDIIEKRGGIGSTPEELVDCFIVQCAFMTILPHFIYYKYDLKIPNDTLDWRPC